MRFGLPLILGLVTFFDGLTFTFGHYRPDTLLPFEVLNPVLPSPPTAWLNAQHTWGLLYLVVGVATVLPAHIVQRAIALVAGTVLWGAFGTAMAATATILDPHHLTGGGTACAFLGFAILYGLAISYLYPGFRADRQQLDRWCARIRHRKPASKTAKHIPLRSDPL